MAVITDIDLDNVNGIQPKLLLRDGETAEASSASSNRKYTIKRTWDHYYCNCPAWRNAGGPTNGRTCKHLKNLLGDAYEEARLELMNPSDDASNESGVPAVAAATNKRTKTARSNKRKLEDEAKQDEDEKAVKRTRGKTFAISRNSKTNSKSGSAGDEENDEEKATTATRVSQRQKAPPVKYSQFKPLLAEKWDLEKGRNPIGWHMSEKLDGVRAYWNGEKFLSREGNQFFAPKWFVERLPKDVTLDGELFTTRGGFQDCVSIVRCANKPDKWKAVTYQIFDCPSMGSDAFEDRISFLKKHFSGEGAIEWVNVLTHTVCKSRDHLFEMLDEITSSKGEGLMLREPRSLYHQGRSKSLLKVKRFFDADAIVRGYEKGSGKNANCTGALKCEMLDSAGEPTGKMFKVGSGLTDAQRRKPPKIGCKIVYRYQELTRDGVPRFPSYWGERAD